MPYNVSAAPGYLVAVGLELPPEVAGELAAFRAKYDPSYSAILPNGGAHITLKRPDQALRPIEQTVARLRQLIEQIPALRLEVSGITVYHSSGESTIYLRVLANPALLKLHRLLHAGLQGYLAMQANFEGQFFVPHVTLANWLSDRELGRAMQDLNGLVGFRKEFCCTELSVAVCQSGPKLRQWVREESFFLNDM